MNTATNDDCVSAATSDADRRPMVARAAVTRPDMTTEVITIRARSKPDVAGWLQVETSALCGGDVALLKAGLRAPTILGHHVVGRVLSLEDGLRSQWGVAVGDRVALEEYLPCQQPDCPGCGSRDGYRFCPEVDPWGQGRRVGLLPVTEGSGLHGGNAQLLQLRPNTVLHPVPPGLDPGLASWTQAFANALDWTVNIGGAGEGSGVVVIGPGRHGIAAVAAARLAGAGRVVCVGLAQDEERLEIARALGAQPLVSAPDELVSRVRAEADGHRLDVIVDTVGLGQPVIELGVQLLQPLGKVVVSGPTRGPSMVAVDVSALVHGGLTITAVRGRAPGAMAQSLQALAAGSSGLEQVPETKVPLDGVGRLLNELTAGHARTSPHIVVYPWS